MPLETLNRKNKKDLKWPKIIIAILSTIGIVDTGSITLKIKKFKQHIVHNLYAKIILG